MIRLMTPERMRKLEEGFMQETGMPGLLLMEHAAQAVADAAAEMTQEGALFLCGGGNNGGDGWAAARIFASMGRKSVIWALQAPQNLRGDALLNAQLAMKLGIETHIVEEGLPEKAPEGCGVVVDALFGTGLSRNLEGRWAEAVHWMNECPLEVLAVDIPSGIDGESGRILGCAVKAQRTVTFHSMKNGHILYPGREYSGRITTVDIGLPQAICQDDMTVLEDADVEKMLPKRQLQAHKGSCGHALIIGGSRGMAGACAFSAEAALRTGAGLVTVACPGEMVCVMQSVFPGAMCKALEEDLTEIRRGKTCAAIGPGLGGAAEQALERMLDFEGPLLIDADGLNALASRKEKTDLSNAILTPHPGEAARLLQCDTTQIVKHPREAALDIHRKFGAVVLLKGACTVVTDGKRMAANASGSPALAMGGSGDILTGMIAALLAQKLPLFEAACLGAFLHGRAGEAAGKVRGERSVTPRDILDALHIE